MMCVALPLLALVVLAAGISPPEQVHLALGKGDDKLNVAWVTQDDAPNSMVFWGTAEDSLSFNTTADSRAFTVDKGRKWFTHTAVMTGLRTATKYYYKVGDATNGFTRVYHVTNRRSGPPYRHILMGDMGAACAFTLCKACNASSTVCDAAACKGNTTVGMVSEVESADMFLHVGDFAYDLDGDDGRVGDQFMRNIEQLAAYVPYMVSHGNHEDSAAKLAHYIERFRHMPSNAHPATFHTKNGESTNTLYYSWDHGLVHYVAISTELWFGVVDWHTSMFTLLEWLKKDLKKANENRANVPWIVVHGHRSMYCSCDKDCGWGAWWLRESLEHIFFEYGVDFFVNGHEHNYERMWPTYHNKSDQSNINPKATVYIVTGAAGSHEMHEPFTRPMPSWSAFRSNTFSYSRMIVHNASHIHWEQVQTDPTLFPGADYGRVIDSVWYVQHQHGPFNAVEAPKHKPAACNMCRQIDHWAPMLGLEDGTGRPTDELIREFRSKHGDDAWRGKLSQLMAQVNKGLLVWEDVRDDGNSDGAWAYTNGTKSFKWTSARDA